jgi:hypothetical protein
MRVALSPAASLDVVRMTNQGAVMVQDLFYAEGDRRNLILKRHVPRSANQNAEQSGPRVTEAKQRAPITFQSRKDLNRLTRQRDESLGKFQSRPKDFSRDRSARNLNLETRDRLIPLDSDDPVQFVLSEFPLKISNNRLGRARPKVRCKVRRTMRSPMRIGYRVGEESEVLRQ